MNRWMESRRCFMDVLMEQKRDWIQRKTKKQIIQSLFVFIWKTQNESLNGKSSMFHGYFCGTKERLNSKKNIKTNIQSLFVFIWKTLKESSNGKQWRLNTRHLGWSHKVRRLQPVKSAIRLDSQRESSWKPTPISGHRCDRRSHPAALCFAKLKALGNEQVNKD